jgi:hypothetical protein
MFVSDDKRRKGKIVQTSGEPTSGARAPFFTEYGTLRPWPRLSTMTVAGST